MFKKSRNLFSGNVGPLSFVDSFFYETSILLKFGTKVKPLFITTSKEKETTFFVPKTTTPQLIVSYEIRLYLYPLFFLFSRSFQIKSEKTFYFFQGSFYLHFFIYFLFLFFFFCHLMKKEQKKRNKKNNKKRNKK